MRIQKHNRFWSALIAAVAASALLPAPAVAGDTMLKLLKVLKDRGSITDVEYQMLLAAAEEEAAGKAVTAAAPPASVGVGTAGAPVAQAPVAPAAQAGTVAAAAPAHAAGPAAAKSPKPKWYDRISIGGYAQLRYSSILDQDGANLTVPNDATVSDSSSFFLRRGRIKISGDVTDRLYVYAQADFNASLSSGETSVSMRDYYADYAFDEKREYRVRLGQSKVPFGWVNMQSSQNRIPMERPDALNSAVEGERDIGAYFLWASEEARQRFSDLVKLGLKGSGDYGVVDIGAYSGQGLNRLDANGEPHVVARVSYPWKLDSGQYFETGIQAYHGRFVSPVSSISLGGPAFTPTRSANGVLDERIGATFVWYPQPFGVEAEWNMGRGPELNGNQITSEFLHGGYVQLSYRIEDFLGDWFPFVRWQYYDGGRKFAANAPRDQVNEMDVGFEWQPRRELEISVSYSHTFDRTNTKAAPYAQTGSADRIAFQAQINF